MDTKNVIGFMAVVAVIAALCVIPAVSDDADATATTYTVSYNVDGVTYSTDVTSEDGKITLATLSSLNVDLPENKKFNGWTVADEGTEDTNIYAAGSTYTVSDGNTVSFKASIEVITYTVKFVEPTGTVISEIPEKQDLNAKIVAPGAKTAEVAGYTVPAGHVFAGWSIDGKIVEPDENGKYTVTGDMTFVATYELDITVSFVVDGTTIYTHVMTGLIYPDDPAKESFTFIGWAVDGKVVLPADADVEDIQALKLESNTVLTAQFEPAIYTVTFVVEGETAVTQTVKHGELATEPSFTPAKDGFTFEGWDYDFAKPITGETTINAVFEEIPPAEPTGLRDPIVQTLCIILGVPAVAVVALAIWAQKKGKIAFANPIKRVKAEKKTEEKSEEEAKP